MKVIDLTNPKILELVGGILANDGVSADIVGRELNHLLDKGFYRNTGVIETESDDAFIVRAVITTLLEVTKGEFIDPE